MFSSNLQPEAKMAYSVWRVAYVLDGSGVRIPAEAKDFSSRNLLDQL
jgi:hypothetical protein